MLSDQFKYNIYKAISTALTFLTPIVTSLCIGNFFTSPERTMSITAIFACIISLFFIKDKLAERFKSPTALTIALIAFIFCVITQSIIDKLKYVSLATIIACGVDEATFKRMYKNIELQFEEVVKKFGFITKYKLKEVNND